MKFPLMDGQQTGKGAGVVRVLLQQRRYQGGCVKTGLPHNSNPAQTPASLLAFLVQEGPEIPGGRGKFAGANQKTVLRRQCRGGMDRPKPKPVGFHQHLQLMAGCQREPVPKRFWDYDATHLVQRQLHGNHDTVYQMACQTADREGADPSPGSRPDDLQSLEWNVQGQFDLLVNPLD